MYFLRYLALAALVAVTVAANSDGGPGMDPNGGANAASGCRGDYTGCVDPNG